MIGNNKGMSLVQTLAAIGVTALSMGAIAQIMSNTMSLGKDIDIRSIMDTRHADLVHRASSLRFLRSHFQISDSGSGVLENCLKGKGTSCQSFAAAQKKLADKEGDFNSFYGVHNGKCSQVSEDCVISQAASYSWICPDSTECTELQLNLRTSYMGTKKLKSLKDRISEVVIPARGLLSRGDIDFSCTSSQMIMGVDYKKLRALCAPLSGVVQTSNDKPAISLGPSMEANPGVSDCPSGLSEVGFFASQSQCVGGPAAPIVKEEGEPGTCTPAQLTELSSLMIQNLRVTVNEISERCIDEVNPTLDSNLPINPHKTLRFKNTCGNRYCKSKGFATGRVTELYNGETVIECRHNKVPASIINPCSSLISGTASPIQTFAMRQVDLQRECIDAVTPTVEASDPALGSEAESRFMLTCGARTCLSRGFNDGRVVEMYNGAISVECYKDLEDLFENVNATVTQIANNCIDGAVTTLEGNLPSAGGSAQERFMITCGNRYCVKMGYRSGAVKEFFGDAALLRCIK